MMIMIIVISIIIIINIIMSMGLPGGGGGGGGAGGTGIIYCTLLRHAPCFDAGAKKSSFFQVVANAFAPPTTPVLWVI